MSAEVTAAWQKFYAEAEEMFKEAYEKRKMPESKDIGALIRIMPMTYKVAELAEKGILVSKVSYDWFVNGKEPSDEDARAILETIPGINGLAKDVAGGLSSLGLLVPKPDDGSYYVKSAFRGVPSFANKD